MAEAGAAGGRQRARTSCQQLEESSSSSSSSPLTSRAAPLGGVGGVVGTGGQRSIGGQGLLAQVYGG